MILAVLVFVHYLPHWKETTDPDAKRSVFCTAPAIRNLWMNFISEVIGTAVLVLVAGAMSSKLVLSQGAAAGLSPYLVSCLVWGVGLHPSIVTASLRAVVNAVNRALAQRKALDGAMLFD